MKEDADPVPEHDPEPAAGEMAAEPRRSWRETLVADNELERHDALLSILGEEQPDFLRTVPGLAGAARNLLLEALWQQVDVLLLEGRDKARPLFALACSHSEDPTLKQHWLQLMAFYRPADPAAPFDPGRVAKALEASPEGYRGAWARALLIHPSTEVRAMARAALEPADFWHVIVSTTTSSRVLFEIWQGLRGRVPGDFFKIFLSAIAGRFLGELQREQLGLVSRFFGALLQVEVFRERAYRQLVIAIEKNLRAQAQRHGIDLGEDAEYSHRVQDFLEEPVDPEQPIQLWSQIPLPVQRTLAGRGLFLRHFCCHPVDAVALQCFPHLLRRADLVEFLKILTLNTRLLGQLAEEKQLFESDAAKFFLLANPRCPFHTIGKYMGYLTTESLTKLSQGYLYNTFARKQAERLLEQRGKAGKPAPLPKHGKRRPT